MSMVVTIKDDKHVEIQKFEGELPVGKRKVFIDDFIRSMLGFMENQELLSYLFEKDYIEVIKDYMEEEGDIKVFTQIMEVVIKRVERESESLESNNLYVELLTQLINKVDIQKIDNSWLKQILKSAFNNINQMDSDVIEYQDLLKILLNKANVNPELSTPVLSKILDVAAKKVQISENKEELKALFLSIADKSEVDWVEKVLAKNTPNRLVYKGFMPKNVLYYHKTFSDEMIVIDIPKRQFDVKFHDVKYEKVGHPRMLFAFRVADNKIRSLKIACVKDKIINEETKLYLYPYSNVFADHGVCWTYSQYDIDSLEKLQHIPYIFLNTPNNSHVNGRTRELFEANCEKEFNNEDLQTSGYTFAQLVGLNQ